MTQVTRGGRAQVAGWSLIDRKASHVSRKSVASVSRRSGRGRGSGVRVYADRLTNGVRGSRARKSVVVRSQVTLINFSGVGIHNNRAFSDKFLKFCMHVGMGQKFSKLIARKLGSTSGG